MTCAIYEFDLAEIDDSHACHATLAAFAALYPRLDPQTLYCLFTGAPIGITVWSELEATIESMTGTPRQNAYDLATRIIASSRPSVLWNQIRVTDIDRLRQRFSAETLCYLLNGAGGVPKGASFFPEMLHRIEQFQLIQAMPADERESRWYAFYRAESDALSDSQRAARLMRHWCSLTDETGLRARRDATVARLEAEADSIRDKRAKRFRAAPSAETLKRRAREAEHERKLSMAEAFLDSIFDTPIPLPATALTPTPANDSVPAANAAPRIGFTIRVAATQKAAR